jgi:hypothetical protein
MAHFAELDSNNMVLRVIVISNEDILDEQGREREALGIQFCKNLYGQDTEWVQTSYNRNFRRHYAAPDGRYDSVKNEFIERQPFPSWTLDSNNDWQPPTEKPSPTSEYEDYWWDEENQVWVGLPVNPDPPPSTHWDEELGCFVPDDQDAWNAWEARQP